MWTFKGKYTGEAKDYIRQRDKKMFWITGGIIFALFMAVGGGLAVYAPDMAVLSWSLSAGMIVLFGLALFLIYLLSKPKCEIEITNDGMRGYYNGRNFDYTFFRLDGFEYRDGFIVVKQRKFVVCVLQRELLTGGDWEQLLDTLKDIQARADSDDPVFQIDEPQTEFVAATVVSKRLYTHYEQNGLLQLPETVTRFFVTFAPQGGESVEFEVSKEMYDGVGEGQEGTLVTVGGNFFDFGDGEDVA